MSADLSVCLNDPFSTGTETINYGNIKLYFNRFIANRSDKSTK